MDCMPECRLEKYLFCFADNRIAVHFQVRSSVASTLETFCWAHARPANTLGCRSRVCLRAVRVP